MKVMLVRLWGFYTGKVIGNFEFSTYVHCNGTLFKSGLLSIIP